MRNGFVQNNVILHQAASQMSRRSCFFNLDLDAAGGYDNRSDCRTDVSDSSSSGGCSGTATKAPSSAVPSSLSSNAVCSSSRATSNVEFGALVERLKEVDDGSYGSFREYLLEAFGEVLEEKAALPPAVVPRCRRQDDMLLVGRRPRKQSSRSPSMSRQWRRARRDVTLQGGLPPGQHDGCDSLRLLRDASSARGTRLRCCLTGKPCNARGDEQLVSKSMDSLNDSQDARVAAAASQDVELNVHPKQAQPALPQFLAWLVEGVPIRLRCSRRRALSSSSESNMQEKQCLPQVVPNT